MSILWKNDPAYLLNADRLHQMMPDVVCFGSQYIHAVNLTSIKINAHTQIKIYNNGAYKMFNVGAVDVTLAASNLDAGGSFTIGTNYYVYLCDNGTDNETYLISANTTYPAGYNANNSRKIGGFHYGYVRNSITVADVSSGIVSNSVWDLKHRPKSSPEGMAYLGAGLWVDIYLASVNEAITFNGGNGYPLLTGTAKSIYNATPLTGTEGLSGYNFIELARRSGKRLLTMAEWLQSAHGSPQGNQYGGNITTRGITGENANIGSISLTNVVDCSRKIWQWLDEYISKGDQTGWNWYNVMPEMNVGQIYEYGLYSLVQVIAGGSWDDGVYAGSRCVRLTSYPWDVNSGIGSRFACGSL